MFAACYCWPFRRRGAMGLPTGGWVVRTWALRRHLSFDGRVDEQSEAVFERVSGASCPALEAGRQRESLAHDLEFTGCGSACD